MNKTIYDLKLHEYIIIDYSDTIVTRVPGGWIYEIERSNGHSRGRLINTIFVPYNNEYQNETNL